MENDNMPFGGLREKWTWRVPCWKYYWKPQDDVHKAVSQAGGLTDVTYKEDACVACEKWETI